MSESFEMIYQHLLNNDIATISVSIKATIICKIFPKNV